MPWLIAPRTHATPAHLRHGHLSMAATGPTPSSIDYEPAGELKIGQVGIANLRVRTLDVAQLAAEMRDRVARAPKLFARAAVVVDFGGLAKTPDAATARALLDALRDAGVLPVALAYGTSDNEQLAQQLGLPLLAKFRAQYESAGPAPVESAPAAPAQAPRRRRRAAEARTKTAPASRDKAPPAASPAWSRPRRCVPASRSMPRTATSPSSPPSAPAPK